MEKSVITWEENDPELIRDIGDIARLSMRYPGWDFVLVTAANTLGPKTPCGRTMWNQLERDVFGVLAGNPRKEWTARDMKTRLQDTGKGSSLPKGAEESQMAGVSNALTNLKEYGLADLAYKGAGHKGQSRYRTKTGAGWLSASVEIPKAMTRFKSP